MLNRTKAVTNESLDTRRAITVELREQLREVPPSPFDWASFDPASALRTGGASLDLRLANMARLLCTVPVRSAELRALWNESVATAAFALRLAPYVGGDADTSASAGLLHRLGDMLTIRAIAVVEHASRLRIDAASKADLCAEHGGEQLDRAVRQWAVPPRAAATAAEWRRLREFPDAAADASAVWLGRLLAIELLTPQFCAPGMVDQAAEELRLDARTLSDVRRDATIPAVVSGRESRD